jgi:hypothetical protein
MLFLLLFIYLFFCKPMSTTLARVACSVAIGEEKEVGNMSFPKERVCGLHDIYRN